MTIVFMVQTSKHRWTIKSQKGYIIQDDLCFNNSAQAELYVKNYITSFQNWDYKMVPL